MIDTKTCSKCGVEKPLSEFWKRKDTNDGFCYHCKKCKTAYSKLWLNKKREHRKEYDKQYYKKNWERKYKYRMKNKAHRAEYMKQWQKENPEKTKSNTRRRRTRAAALPATITEEQWQETLTATNERCVYCGAPYEHQDHFVPVSKGGGYTVNNIVPACASCNLSKNNKDPFEFIKELRNPND